MAIVKIRAIDALIVVDMQNDFMPGGALPVENALTIIPTINEYLKIFNDSAAVIVATRDWHPPNHISFNTRGGPWPPHCIQGSKGAEFHPLLKLPSSAIVVSKAIDENREAYSGFDSTELESVLRRRGVKRVFVCGVATEYCVRATAIDAMKLGFQTHILIDAIKGIDRVRSEEVMNELLNCGSIALEIKDLRR
ncbi:MAG: nicotinamidase [Ignisphaera sp.]|nr:nicotinamidase [Ignisphaera sp.]MCX8167410.1 nicotinamidase [Ignisphaera sp.]MDW8085934.1 nicotinamidase [Ignisphaera sp.]